MNALQLRACAVWFHKLADDAYIVWRTLVTWGAPEPLVTESCGVANRMRSLATRLELAAHKAEAGTAAAVVEVTPLAAER